MINKENGDYKSLLKEAYLDIRQLRSKLSAIENQEVEPIAIIGMGCRFPGAPDLDSFWELLSNGLDAVQEVPADRWKWQLFFDKNQGLNNKTYSRWGGYLKNIDQFDPLFFNISPREAMLMDPQQRIFLEIAFETFEHAGYTSEKIDQYEVGVFVGCSNNGYYNRIFQFLTSLDHSAGLGNQNAIIANRISFFLNLHGPSLLIDTMCSSSLVALQIACDNLRMGTCNLALVGGVNILLSPEYYVAMSRMKVFSPDGRCKTFDNKADGIVLGEGLGAVLLKPLNHALRDADKIYGVIKGSAVNHGGETNGLSSPNPLAQADLIISALKKSGLTAGDISYIEAHGTGTSLGDPIEIEGLTKAFRNYTNHNQFCRIGSVKTNIGHLESAAGIAQLIKVLLCFQHGKLPPSLHLEKINDLISFEQTPFLVNTELVPWDVKGKMRAGISSFGMGGTNAHVIVEEGPEVKRLGNGMERPYHVLAISGKGDGAIDELALRYINFLGCQQEASLGDICFSANRGRNHFSHRAGFSASSLEDLVGQLKAFRAGNRQGSGQCKDNKAPKIAFLFTGQGAQYAKMGQELYLTQPLFHQLIDHCSEVLAPYIKRPLTEVLFQSSGDLLQQTTYSQAALFCIEYALVRLWESWGIRPAWVMGHSVGEYVAACVAGVFTLEEGLKLIGHRGIYMQSMTGAGGMAAVFSDVSTVEGIIANKRVWIASVNSPSHVVISGEKTDLTLVLSEIHSAGIHSQLLEVSHAFHSPLMEPMLSSFKQIAEEIGYEMPVLRIISNITGEEADRSMGRASYWIDHITSPVRFYKGLSILEKQDIDIFMEIGPGSTLVSFGKTSVAGKQKYKWLPGISNRKSEWKQLQETLVQLYISGARIDWESFDKAYNRNKVTLPGYPFQRQRYWIENSEGAEQIVSIPKNHEDYHPLVGQRLLSPLNEILFINNLSQETALFLKDHEIFSKIVFPGTAYLEMALAAGKDVFKSKDLALSNVTIGKPLFLEKESTHVRVILKNVANSVYSFQVFSFNNKVNDDDTWILHANGQVLLNSVKSRVIDLLAIQSEIKEEISSQALYRELRSRGINLGESFQVVNKIWKTKNGILGKINLPEKLIPEFSSYCIHPVLLDGCLHLSAVGLSNKNKTYIPVGLESLVFYRSMTTELWCYITLIASDETSAQINLQLFNNSNELISELHGLTFLFVEQHNLSDHTPRNLEEDLYEITWKPKTLIKEPAFMLTSNIRWVIFANNSELSKKLISQLSEKGFHYYLIFEGGEYKAIRNGHFEINPASEKDYYRLVAEFEEEDPHIPYVVIHLWSTSGFNEPNITADSLNKAQVNGSLSIIHFIKAINNRPTISLNALCLVTRGCQSITDEPGPLDIKQATIWGLGRVIALEQVNFNCRRIDLNPVDEESEAQYILDELIYSDQEDQVAFRAESRYVARMVKTKLIKSTATELLPIPLKGPYTIRLSKYSFPVCLEIAPSSNIDLNEDEIMVKVKACGLNFRDILNALGMFKDYLYTKGISSAQQVPLGGEFAGEVLSVGSRVSKFKQGDRVAGLALGSMQSHIHVKASLVTKIPENINYEGAATIPTAFLTAYYSLIKLAGIKKSDRVLIHSAAGGVGQAAVQLIQLEGGEIFATASTSKWNALKSMGIQHVMDSRTLDFSDEIMSLTNGVGVDIVLNCFNGEFIKKSLDVCKQNGKFIEIGKIGIWEVEQVKRYRPDIAYFNFDLSEISIKNPELVSIMINEIIELAELSKISPIVHKTFPVAEAAEAFKYMAQAKQTGKIIISFQDSSEKGLNKITAIRNNASYLITGGFGALGLKVAEWLCEQGGKHLILLGRSGCSTVKAKEVISELKKKGVSIKILSSDLTDPQDINEIEAEIKNLNAPLKGIFHMAGILDDSLVLNESEERFYRVLAPKVAGTWNLHSISLQANLDFFVCFSSVASVLGSPGQASYSAANSFMDAFAHYRKNLGLPALSINWGPWSEDGMAANMKQRNRGSLNESFTGIRSAEGLEILNKLLTSNYTQISVLPVNWSAIQKKLILNKPSFLFLEGLVQEQNAPQNTDVNLLSALETIPISDRRAYLSSYISLEIGRVLGITNVDQIPPRQRLFDLGLDSLMALELNNRIQAGLKRSLPPTLLFNYPTIEALTNYFIEQILPKELFANSDEKQPKTNISEANGYDSVMRLSQNELENLIDGELNNLMK